LGQNIRTGIAKERERKEKMAERDRLLKEQRDVMTGQVKQGAMLLHKAYLLLIYLMKLRLFLKTTLKKLPTILTFRLPNRLLPPRPFFPKPQPGN
jgi:hypothetical protein